MDKYKKNRKFPPVKFLEQFVHERFVYCVYVCEQCEEKPDIPLYHFGRHDGHNISMAYGCKHWIRSSYPNNPPSDEQLKSHLVQPEERFFKPDDFNLSR